VLVPIFLENILSGQSKVKASFLHQSNNHLYVITEIIFKLQTFFTNFLPQCEKICRPIGPANSSFILVETSAAWKAEHDFVGRLD